MLMICIRNNRKGFAQNNKDRLVEKEEKVFPYCREGKWKNVFLQHRHTILIKLRGQRRLIIIGVEKGTKMYRLMPRVGLSLRTIT